MLRAYFKNAALCQGTTLQAAEEHRFLSVHDFSRAAETTEKYWAFALRCVFFSSLQLGSG
jgi:hypothetical protein